MRYFTALRYVQYDKEDMGYRYVIPLKVFRSNPLKAGLNEFCFE